MDYAVDDSKIIIIRGTNDILNCGYLASIKEDSWNFPSVDHYCYYQILLRAGFVVESKEIMKFSNSRDCGNFVRKIILDRFCEGVVERTDRYLTNLKDDYLNKGLRIRFNQDPSFRRALMDTGESLLAHCDPDDSQYGTGMDEKTFLKWVETNQVKTDVLLNWFRQYDTCPGKGRLGRNKLGTILMEIRAEELKRRPPSPPPSLVQTIPIASLVQIPPSVQTMPTMPIKLLTDTEIEHHLYQRYVISGVDEGDDDWLVSDQILALEGPLAVLSQYYPTPFTTRKRRYRSVEHYVYGKLFRKLKLGRKAMQKLITTPDPSKLSFLAHRLISDYRKKGKEMRQKGQTKDSKIDQTLDDLIDADNFYENLLEFYERGTKEKFDQYLILKRLLVATGDALLVETCPTTDHLAAYEWTINANESDVQRFLTTSPYNTGDLLRFLLKSDDKLCRYFGRNRAGLALMRLRREYRKANVKPLHAPLLSQTNGELDENRLICFTSTSILHPSYVAPFWTKEGQLFASLQHFLLLETANRLGFSESAKNQLSNCDAAEIDSLWISLIYQRFPNLESYLELMWMGGRDEIFKLGNRLKFEKHPDLLRALLETGDSMLVYCRDRYESEDTEWSIGTTEQELMKWMQECRLNSQTLFNMCASPLERRPAFLGANRLGTLLMELRREFKLRGFQAHTLPKLNLPLDIVFGTGDENDLEDEARLNPYFLLSKKRGLPILDRPNKKRKLNEFSFASTVCSTSFSNATPEMVVSMMGTDQLRQSATMLMTKLSAMRKEMEFEKVNLRQLLDDLANIRDRIPEVEFHVTKSPTPEPKSEPEPEPEPIRKPGVLTADKQEKWRQFECGLLSILKGTLLKQEEMDHSDEGKSLLDSGNWDECKIKPLVDLVWPHLTIRERQTASEWLRYTIGKLETIRAQQHGHRKEIQEPHVGDSLIPMHNATISWVVPQIKVITTQKSEPNDTSGARAGTPQGEGTILDAVKYQADWLVPGNGSCAPRILQPASP